MREAALTALTAQCYTDLGLGAQAINIFQQHSAAGTASRWGYLAGRAQHERRGGRCRLTPARSPDEVTACPPTRRRASTTSVFWTGTGFRPGTADFDAGACL